MKKFILVALMLALCVSLCACGDSAEPLPTNPGTQPGAASTAPNAPEGTAAPGNTVPEGTTAAPTEPAHEHSYKQTVTAPDCVNGGYTTNTCDCGDTYVSDEVAATDHTWVDATCTASKTCSVCGVTEGAPVGHSWNNATCTAPKTCSICGVTEGAPVGHSWNKATCTAPKTCSICGVTEGAPVGHSWNKATCTAPKTCSICGVTEGAPVGHSWNKATCTAPKTCSICGVTEGSPIEHAYSSGVCGHCGESQPNYIAWGTGVWYFDVLDEFGNPYHYEFYISSGYDAQYDYLCKHAASTKVSNEELDDLIAAGYKPYLYNGEYYMIGGYGDWIYMNCIIEGDTVYMTSPSHNCSISFTRTAGDQITVTAQTNFPGLRVGDILSWLQEPYCY